MKCQICHQREANIVFTKIVNNEKKVMHICVECAHKKGLTIEIGSHSSVSGIHEVPLPQGNDEFHSEAEIPDITCERCGTRFIEFRKTGFFGCERCHEVFGDQMDDILKQIHGAAVHDGKTPSSSKRDPELKKHLRTLRMRLKRCIGSEDYERAAELRDKISALEGAVPENDV